MAEEDPRVETTIEGHHVAQHGDDTLYLNAEDKVAVQKPVTNPRKKRRRNPKGTDDTIPATSTLSSSSTIVPSDRTYYDVLEATSNKDKGGLSSNFVAYLNKRDNVGEENNGKNNMEEDNGEGQNSNMIAIVHHNR